MAKNNLAYGRSAAMAAALILAGCGGAKPIRKEAAGSSLPAPAEMVIAVTKGDTAGTMDAGLKADSAKAPTEYASELYMRTLDNYVHVAGEDERVPEILLWKGNHLYNQERFAEALEIYESLPKRFPGSPVVGEASQMAAQSYAQLGRFEEAEKSYRGLLKEGGGALQSEARDRLAQAVYLQAEKAEKDGRLQTASESYQRIAREFPAADIAPIALFNAGVMQERQKKWADAILIYGRFFDAYYESGLLPKVLFREAKCREMDGQWVSAAEKYVNLTRAHPQSPEAEPSLYNAGFAYLNGKMPDSAARLFESYAVKYPQNKESPNLLFRAVEIYGERKNWDKVAELQNLFSRRYAADKGRLIQALCLGGTAAYQRERWDESGRLMKRVVEEFAAMQTGDPSARFYAAQAQHTLGSLAALRMRNASLRAGSYDRDLNAKTGLLKASVEEYLKVLDYRIVDWTLRAAYSLGEGFETFGTGVFESPRKTSANPSEQLDREEEAMASLSAAYTKAQQQYLQVLSIGRKQEVNNRWIGEANARLVAMARRFASYQAGAMSLAPRLIRVDAGTPEKAIAGKLRQIGRMAPYHEQGMKYFLGFLDIAQEYEIDPGTVDSLGAGILRGLRALGGHYLDAADLARSAPIPAGFQPMERFFYQVKLLQEGIPNLEGKAFAYFREGLEFASRYGLEKSPQCDSLRLSLGRAGYVQAKSLDLLSQEALVNPPVPPDAGPAQRRTYLEKIENVGYQLQDQAMEKYRGLVAGTVAGAVPVEWGELAFARLFQMEPDKWTRSGDRDTVIEYVTGKEWTALAELPARGWPGKGAPEWKPVRKGVMPGLDFPADVKAVPRFLWCGDKGMGPKVDGVAASYIPWKRVWAQVPVSIPPNAQSIELEVVGPGEWSVLFDTDTVLGHKELTGPWHKGVARDIYPRLSAKPAPGEHFLRIAAQNQKPADGFGIWARIRVRYRMTGNIAVFPWNQEPPSGEYLKSLLGREIPIPNFSRERR